MCLRPKGKQNKVVRAIDVQFKHVCAGCPWGLMLVSLEGRLSILVEAFNKETILSDAPCACCCGLHVITEDGYGGSTCARSCRAVRTVFVLCNCGIDAGAAHRNADAVNFQQTL